ALCARGGRAAGRWAGAGVARAEPLWVEGWAAGMGHVLAATLAQAGEDWAAVVVLLGDQPLVPGRAVARLVGAWRGGGGGVGLPRRPAAGPGPGGGPAGRGLAGRGRPGGHRHLRWPARPSQA